MSKKWPILYNKLLYKMSHYFLDITVVTCYIKWAIKSQFSCTHGQRFELPSNISSMDILWSTPQSNIIEKMPLSTTIHDQRPRKSKFIWSEFANLTKLNEEWRLRTVNIEMQEMNSYAKKEFNNIKLTIFYFGTVFYLKIRICPWYKNCTGCPPLWLI